MKNVLKNTYQNAIIDILRSNPRVDRAILFGSRAMGTNTVTSDIDIALMGNELTLNDLAELAEKMEELTIPQKVDLILYHRIENENLKKQIQEHGVVWFNRQNNHLNQEV